jgi:hypothetical protein
LAENEVMVTNNHIALELDRVRQRDLFHHVSAGRDGQPLLGGWAEDEMPAVADSDNDSQPQR